MSQETPREIVLRGIGASPGICIGRAYLVDTEGVNVVKKYYIPDSHLDLEKNRFKAAVKKATDDLHAIIEETPEDFKEHANILETHVVLLKDKMLYGKTIETIEKEHVNAEWALKKVVSNIKSIFRGMADNYFRERADDIVQVSDRIMRNLVGADPINIKNIDKRVILVATDLSPAETSQIQLEKIKGFVTDVGGMTSHTGIIARTLEIPAVLGLDHATSIINNDDLLVVDGSKGVLIINPTESTIQKYNEKRQQFEAYRATIARGSHLPAKSIDGHHIRIMGNIELPEEVVSVKNYGGDGIGLYRTEFQYLSRSMFPSEYELFDKYRDVVEVMAPLPVTIRTLDINGDKIISRTRSKAEVNPALGLRGIRYCLKHCDVFKTQLRAILRAAAYGNVRILFPMISTVQEIRDARKIIGKVIEELHREGAIFKPDIAIGVMVEVPSVAIMADVIAREVDFFSIGTNDLIQYTLAIDRGNRHVSDLFSPLHPAILRLIKHTSDAAKNNGIQIYMCGEMAADPLNIPILMGLGIDELSMNPLSIPNAKRAIRALSIEQTKPFIKTVLEQDTAQAVRDLTRSTYKDFADSLANSKG